MTRKDYIAIADAIRRAEPVAMIESERPILRQAWARTADHIADALQADNCRFDRYRFLRACGVEA